MDSSHFEKVCCCALGRIAGFEPAAARTLLLHFGSAARIFGAKKEELELALGPYSKLIKRINDAELDSSFKEMEKLAAEGCDFICINDPFYPPLLKECLDAPVFLYYRGTGSPEEIFRRENYISIVGTRDLSSYGKEWCQRIVESLASCSIKPSIISGLALGTDICAHQSALSNGLPTIGVMATGIDNIYPIQHCFFADKIASNPGSALLTDYPPGTKPLAIHFLRRNRIIAGLSSATILIESRNKGGGMMTARLAAGYDREVYALPGRVDDARSQGCNQLIHSHIAEQIYELSDLCAQLGLEGFRPARHLDFLECVSRRYSEGSCGHCLNDIMKTAEQIKRCRDISFEQLSEATGLSYSAVSSCAMLLESDGFINIDLLQRCAIVPQKV